MRRNLWQFCVVCLLATAGNAYGEEEISPPPTLYVPPRYERPRTPGTNPLLIERAQFRARQRMLRQEARVWRGISSGRPNVAAGSHAVNVNGFQMGGPGSLTWQPRW